MSHEGGESATDKRFSHKMSRGVIGSSQSFDFAMVGPIYSHPELSPLMEHGDDGEGVSGGDSELESKMKVKAFTRWPFSNSNEYRLYLDRVQRRRSTGSHYIRRMSGSRLKIKRLRWVRMSLNAFKTSSDIDNQPFGIVSESRFVFLSRWFIQQLTCSRLTCLRRSRGKSRSMERDTKCFTLSSCYPGSTNYHLPKGGLSTNVTEDLLLRANIVC